MGAARGRALREGEGGSVGVQRRKFGAVELGVRLRGGSQSAGGAMQMHAMSMSTAHAHNLLVVLQVHPTELRHARHQLHQRRGHEMLARRCEGEHKGQGWG